MGFSLIFEELSFIASPKVTDCKNLQNAQKKKSAYSAKNYALSNAISFPIALLSHNRNQA